MITLSIMSSLPAFLQYPENTRYTLSKQALGLWPCGASLISSMEFPLHFPPSSAGWPQRHRVFSLPVQKLSTAKIKNKTNPSKVRSPWQTQWLQPLGWCFNPAPVLQAAAALLCPRLQLWEPAPGHGRAQTDAAIEGCRVKREYKYPDATGILQDFSKPEPEEVTCFKVNQNTRLNSQLSP